MKNLYVYIYMTFLERQTIVTDNILVVAKDEGWESRLTTKKNKGIGGQWNFYTFWFSGGCFTMPFLKHIGLILYKGWILLYVN